MTGRISCKNDVQERVTGPQAPQSKRTGDARGGARGAGRLRWIPDVFRPSHRRCPSTSLYPPRPTTRPRAPHPGTVGRATTFERLREQNRGGEPFSFIDGPITANNPMGVHHAWGRTLKDLFQRYHAMRGFDQRYQNGFDCQGLWVEVEVEKALGLNSKREIESYGLDRFSAPAATASPSTARSRREQSRAARAVDGLGAVVLHDDRHQHRVHLGLPPGVPRARGGCTAATGPWRGARAAARRSRSTSCIDSYRDLTHPSLYVRLPLADARRARRWSCGRRRRGRCRPTSPRPCKPDADYAPSRRAGLAWVVAERVEAVFGAGHRVVRRATGSELVGRPYHGPFDDLPGAGRGRSTAWSPGTTSSLDEGTGIVHIAPGCGAEDFELGQREGLPAIVPVDEAGASTSRVRLAARPPTADVATAIVDGPRAARPARCARAS